MDLLEIALRQYHGLLVTNAFEMQPLINQFTKNLSGCSGCGTNLGNPEFDFLWKNKPKEKKDAVRNNKTGSSGSGDAGGSGSEDQ